MRFPVAAILLPAMICSALPTAAQRSPAESRAVTPRGPLGAHEQGVVRLFESVSPSVAYITTQSIARRGIFEQVAAGAGSGFVWDDKGHVVTNHHVVEGAVKVQVQLDAGRTYDAAVVGVAEAYDLAVVKLAQLPPGLRPIAIGTSADLRIGQSVYAIGNPFGLTRTLTQGVVSALDRHLPTSDLREVRGAIQTDAAINPGNSGGPLLDSAGRLIGVTTAIRSASGASAGVGLAIPVDLVNRIVPQLIAKGRAPSPTVGVMAFHPDLVAQAGIVGVVVAGVVPGSPAALAGLKPFDRRAGTLGDVIIAVDNRVVESLPAFAAELDRVGIGREAELTVVHDGKERRVKVKVLDGG